MSGPAAMSGVVKPASSRLEIVATLAVCLALTGVTVGYAALNSGREAAEPLRDWQVSGLGGLNAPDQAIYSALLAVSEEIGLTYADSGEWLSPEDLQWTASPPFYLDGFWEQNGAVKWRLVAPKTVDVNGGGAYYIGVEGRLPEQSSYLLVMAHVHAGLMSANQGQVWIHPGKNPALPTVLKSDSLVREGWKQVVPYRGEDEYRKVRGINP